MSTRRKISQRKLMTDRFIKRTSIHATPLGIVVKTPNGVAYGSDCSSEAYKLANQSNLTHSRIEECGARVIDGSCLRISVPKTVDALKECRSILASFARSVREANEKLRVKDRDAGFRYDTVADSDTHWETFSFRGTTENINIALNRLPSYVRVTESRVHVSHRTEYRIPPRVQDKIPNDRTVSETLLAHAHCDDSHRRIVGKEGTSMAGRYLGKKPTKIT